MQGVNPSQHVFNICCCAGLARAQHNLQAEHICKARREGGSGGSCSGSHPAGGAAADGHSKEVP